MINLYRNKRVLADELFPRNLNRLSKEQEKYILSATYSMVKNIVKGIVEKGQDKQSIPFNDIINQWELHTSIAIATEEDYRLLIKTYNQILDLIKDYDILPPHVQKKLQSLHDSLYTILYGDISQE